MFPVYTAGGVAMHSLRTRIISVGCYSHCHVIRPTTGGRLAFVYIGHEGRPLWELLPFLKSLAIVLSLYYYQYYRTVPVIILLSALFLLPLYNIRIVQVPS